MTIILHTARIYRNGDRPPPDGKDGMSICHAMLMRNDDVIEGGILWIRKVESPK